MTNVAGTLDGTRTLAALVVEEPDRARVFEQFGLDYCCHGERPLRAACAEAGVDERALLDALAGVTRSDDTSVEDLAPGELATHIVDEHHAYLHQELAPLQALAEKVRDVHGDRHPELVEVARLVARARGALEPHLAHEEAVVFPALAAGTQATSELRDEIGRLRREHRALGTVLAELRSASANYEVPADGCASYQALYHRLAFFEHDTFRHIHLENNVLFPAVGAPEAASA